MLDTTPDRRRAMLAELDRLIALAEAARVRCLAGAVAEAAAAPVAAGRNEAGRAETVLGLVDERLAALRRSRAALLADDGGQAGGKS